MKMNRQIKLLDCLTVLTIITIASMVNMGLFLLGAIIFGFLLVIWIIAYLLKGKEKND
jgi:nitric oxide reductase large subunit